ncbi:MAG: FtsX-like permease family protein [Phycisphaera sp.]|nr:FtsX-like permease family protein [Phycisphaera sp.]
MYSLALILRYLRRKLAPLFAMVAVTLCTAMVIVIISIMGGFLDMMRNSVRSITGQVTVRSSLEGIPHYENLIEDLRQLPGVDAVTPVMRSFGLLKLRDEVHTVELVGIEPAGFDRVMTHFDTQALKTRSYRDTLYWSSKDILDYLRPEDDAPPLVSETYRKQVELYNRIDLRDLGMTMKPPAEWNMGTTITRGLVPGIEISNFAYRDDKGRYNIAASSVGTVATLTVLPISLSGAPKAPEHQQFAVVNEFKSGLYEVDANRVFVPFDALQQMLQMDRYESPNFDPETGKPLPGAGLVTPARTSEITLRGHDGVPLDVLADRVQRAANKFMNDNLDVPPMRVITWKQMHATLLGAVEKEKGMVTFLFGFISIVAVIMIGVIFSMIVMQKTRDIGILRALGATPTGIASIFLGYGLTIGVIGSVLGTALAVSIVWNINEIQAQLYAWFGFQMWNPQVYYFDTIPHQVNVVEVAWIVTVAIVASVLSSIIPAIQAARLDPVVTLRYE